MGDEWATEGFISKRENSADWFEVVDYNNNKVGLIKREWITNLLEGKKKAAPIKSPPDYAQK